MEGGLRRQPCSDLGENPEYAFVDVSVRYILAAFAFGVAVLGFILL